MSNFKFRTGEIESVFERSGIDFTRTGHWIMINCPFHEEEVPSCGIHTLNGGFNCFGCGKRGNFADLCKKLNITPELNEVEGPSEADFNAKISKLRSNNNTPKKLKLYEKHFKSLNSRRNRNTECGEDIIDYLHNRGVGLTTIVDFEIGYINYGPYIGRVAIPVYDITGKEIIWFEGRAIKKTMMPPYFRPKGSPKKSTVFNYHRVHDKDSVIVTEGIMDAIVLHSWGYPSVCVFGTNYNIDQLILLSSFEKVHFCFDGDGPGRNAAASIRRSRELETGSNYYIIPMPDGRDPASLTRDEFKYQLKRTRRISIS